MRNGMVNLCSLPELERLGFRITYETLEEWVVTSPEGGARIIFKRDIGRCEGFPFVYLDDAVTQAFFDVAREELRKGETFLSIFPYHNHTGRIITKSGQ